MDLTDEELIRRLEAVEAYVEALPDWDGAGKLRGKLSMLGQAREEWSRSGNIDELRNVISELELAVQRLSQDDPLTQLHRQLRELQQSLRSQNTSGPPDP